MFLFRYISSKYFLTSLRVFSYISIALSFFLQYAIKHFYINYK